MISISYYYVILEAFFILISRKTTRIGAGRGKSESPYGSGKAESIKILLGYRVFLMIIEKYDMMEHIHGNPDEKLGVVFVAVGYPSSRDPVRGIFIHRRVKSLAKHARVSVIQLRGWRPGISIIEKRIWDEVPVLTIAVPQVPLRYFKPLNVAVLALFARKYALSITQQADLILSNGLYPTGYIVNRWVTTVNRPHVSWAMGSDVNIDLQNTKISGLDRSWLFNLDGIICTSQKISLELSKILPGISNTRVIYNGVDIEMFSPQGPAAGPLSGLPQVRYLFLGGFQTWNPNRYDPDNFKGGHILLEAWKRAEMKVGSSSLLLGGPGINAVHLQPWLAKLQRPDAVHILPVAPPEMVPGLLRSCDVTIIPSLKEGLPNLANESQACGRPVLGSDAGGIPETVLHESTGRIVPKGDANQLAEGIVWFYEHQDQLPEMGKRARKHMIADFNWETSAQKMMSLFHSAIAYHSQRYIE
jgi:glycosyltransferase involved in cell wall biosynthesis